MKVGDKVIVPCIPRPHRWHSEHGIIIEVLYVVRVDMPQDSDDDCIRTVSELILPRKADTIEMYSSVSEGLCLSGLRKLSQLLHSWCNSLLALLPTRKQKQ